MSKPTTSDCAGCRDDFYNHDNNGVNGVCWSLEHAKLVQLRLVPLDMYPPWDRLPKLTKPSCYRKPGCVSVKVEKP